MSQPGSVFTAAPSASVGALKKIFSAASLILV